MWGFGAEMLPGFGGFWPVILGVVCPLMLFVTVVLTVIFDERVHLSSAILAGLTAGSLVAILFVLGVSSPFFLELGERDIEDLGGEITWQDAVGRDAVLFGLGGAAMGVVGGGLAWAVQRKPGRKEST